LVYWFIGLLAGWLVSWLAGWLVGWLDGRPPPDPKRTLNQICVFSFNFDSGTHSN
jgi:hypothetical protein